MMYSIILLHYLYHQLQLSFHPITENNIQLKLIRTRRREKKLKEKEEKEEKRRKKSYSCKFNT